MFNFFRKKYIIKYKKFFERRLNGMISIKEACRYQNFLMSNINELNYLLRDKNNLTIVTENHFKSKGSATAQDEVIVEENERIFNKSNE